MRRRRKTVVVELTNGIGFPVEQVELTVGEEKQLTLNAVLNVCDRGLGSKDGKHRLVTKTLSFPVRVRLVDEP